MRCKRIAALIVTLLMAGCSSGDSENSGDGETYSGSIGADEVNRYELDAVGKVSFGHTGGLICAVEDGDLVLDFSIDASDGDYEYGAVFPGFDPSLSSFQGEFTLTQSVIGDSTGTVNLSFGLGPAPDGYPGVVRAAGTFAGPVTGDAGAAEMAGSYACLLMDSEVGN